MRATRLWPLIALAVAVLPAPADARDFRGRMGDRAREFPGRMGDRGRPRDFARVDPGRRPFHHHFHRFNRVPVFIAPSTVVVAPFFNYGTPDPPSPPPVVYASPPPMYSSPTAYYAPPPVSYAPPPSAPAPPPAPTAPPEPQVVEFDSGRYELRGDGLREPYVWVWIPRAPSAPPGQASAPRKRATVYRWVDDNGVTTLTDDPNKVPPQFRALELTPR